MKILSLFLLFLLLNGVFGEESVSVMTGGSVTLHTHVDIDDIDFLKWSFNGVRIAHMQAHDYVQILRERIQLDDRTGHLTITNMRTTDTGLYELIIFSNWGISKRIFDVTVSDEDKSWFSTHNWTDFNTPKDLFLQPIVLICVASVVTILVLAIVLCCICWKCRKRHRDGVSGVESNEMKTIQDGVKTIKVKMGNSVILDTGITEVQTCDLIQWKMVQLGNSSDPFILLATMTKTNKKEPLNDGVRTFRERLKLDHQTGNLTITNASITDTGVYKLEITDPRYKISKAFIVTVSENGGDESEDINSPLMRDAQQH